MDSRRKYQAFGWTLESDQEIPDLLPASSSAVDLRLRLGFLPARANDISTLSLKPWYSTDGTDEGGRPHRVIWHIPDSSLYLLEYHDGHRFVFDREATEVWSEWPADSTLADNLTYLLGPIFGILLTLRGITCLHASCVRIGDGCVALVGGPGAGKSTTAAAFAMRGHTILSDDITTLEARAGQVVVRPAHPRIRLWPDSAAVLGLPLESLPLLTPTWDKRFLDLRGDGLAFAHESWPLQGIYVLQGREDERSRPCLEATAPRDTMLDLLGNVYTAQLPDEGRSVRDFPLLRELVSRMPVCRALPHADPTRLPRLCELIESDLSSHSGASTATYV